MDDKLSIADISFACDFTQFQRELYFSKHLQALEQEPISFAQSANLGKLPTTIQGTATDAFPNIGRYLESLLQQSDIAADLAGYVEDLRGKLEHQHAKASKLG